MAKQRKRRSCVHFPADLLQGSRDSSHYVDSLILDYLANKALSTCLDQAASFGRNDSSKASHATGAEQLRRHLKMVDSFLVIFQAHHPRSRIPETTRFRLSTLRFCRLFLDASKTRPQIERHPEPSQHLTQLRLDNRLRAEAWWGRKRGSYSQGTPAAISQEEDKADALAYLLERADRSTDSGSTDDGNDGSSPSLLDLMPLFFRLSYERIQMVGEDGIIRKRWLTLAVEFMTQAFLEQRVAFGAKGGSALLESFAWGPVDDTSTSAETFREAQQEDDIHNVFLVNEKEDSDNESDNETAESSLTDDKQRVSAKEYQYLRDRAISNLDPNTFAAEHPSPDSLSALFARLQDVHPRLAFEQSLWAFLRNLDVSVDTPLLAQLEQVENGVRTGIDLDKRRLTDEETERLRQLWQRPHIDDHDLDIPDQSKSLSLPVQQFLNKLMCL